MVRVVIQGSSKQPHKIRVFTVNKQYITPVGLLKYHTDKSNFTLNYLLLYHQSEVSNMSKIISVVSWKGGVGKTTTAVNISSYLQMQGKRVCAIDLDPQHSLSKHFGIHPGHIKNRPTIYDLLYAAVNECDEERMGGLIHQSIIHSTTVDVIPSTPMLASMDKILPTATCRELLLKGILSHLRNEYDYIFLDCHPGGRSAGY